MSEIRYLTAVEIYVINERVVGHRPYVRDRHLLRSAASRPMTHVFGQDAYPTLMEKAAALLHSLAAHHLFSDGNKRTATIAVTQFLEANGIQPDWMEEDIREFVLQIAQHRHEIGAISAWLTAHTVRAE
jgi:death-on-curing protein